MIVVIIVIVDTIIATFVTAIDDVIAIIVYSSIVVFQGKLLEWEEEDFDSLTGDASLLLLIRNNRLKVLT